jgi:signal transduction histidine kinase
MKKGISLLLLFFICFYSYSKTISYYNNSNNITIGKYLEIFSDPSDKLTINDVLKVNYFSASENIVPNLGISSTSFWIKFSIKNESDLDNLLLEYRQSFIDEIILYEIETKSQKVLRIHKSGDKYLFKSREYDYQNIIFDIPITKGEEKEIYINIKSGEQILLPLVLGSPKTIMEANHDFHIIFGIYCGIIIVMFFYNLFIFFTVGDNLYLRYVIYILAIGLTQASLLGYPFQYLWPDFPWLANQSVYLFSCMVSISALEFVKSFLQTKANAPILHKLSYLFTFVYIITGLLALIGYFNISYFFVLVNAALVSFFMLTIGITILRKGFKPAKFFLIAWSSMLIGIIIYVFKDFNILPNNSFTNYTMPAGSALEVILLSLALADRINILKREKEESQTQTLSALLENERIIKEQNILLEAKVDERTSALKKTNNELSTTLTELKQTQSQLVNAEKMASLGQLTAGIAHEINNPINFVVSNVKPLRRDIEDIQKLVQKYEDVNLTSDINEKIKEVNAFRKEIDYDYVKEEIANLLTGIEEGALRTADIVKGLRVFSRLDENDLKKINITDGIESTLTLLNSEISNTMTLVKNYSDIPKIECYPGKMNQVFMNILNNAIFAIKENKERKEKGVLVITTSSDVVFVKISIKDNGLGMSEAVKAKVFEPFFTTKDVGKGTGLGMSITFSIIQDHRGTIEVNTEYGKGTEFIITLPINQLPDKQ